MTHNYVKLRQKQGKGRLSLAALASAKMCVSARSVRGFFNTTLSREIKKQFACEGA